MKSVFFKKSPPDPQLQALRRELQAAQEELACAYHRFNQAVEPELVESCVYQISASKARCNYLLRAIKERAPEAAPSAKAAHRDPGRSRRRAHARPLAAGSALRGPEQEGAAWT